MNNISTELVLQFLGVIFIVLGLAGLLGFWKNWYWRSPRSVYSYVPFGLMLILASMEKPIRAQLEYGNLILIGCYVILFGLGILGFARPPEFLKPGWVRTIDAQPKAVYLHMAGQVKAGLEWRSRIADEQALSRWIKEAQKKTAKTSKKGK